MTEHTQLPLFPLGMVVYPGDRIPLHIFEDRYKDLIKHCLKDDVPFGIVLYESGRMSDIGCACEVGAVTKRYVDGRMDVEVFGTGRFRIGSVTDDGSYLRCNAEWIGRADEPADTEDVQRLISQHKRLLELAGRTIKPEKYDEASHISYFVARNAGLELAQKQEILETDTERSRVGLLNLHLNRFIPKVEHGEAFRLKVRSNGHFTDFPPESTST